MTIAIADEKTVDVAEDRFDEALDLEEGWCPDCEDFTTPDVGARETARECASRCGGDRVLGPRAAASGGFVRVDRAVLS